MTEYSKVSIPKPLFDQLKQRLQTEPLRSMGFRSPSDAVTHAARCMLDEAKGTA